MVVVVSTSGIPATTCNRVSSPCWWQWCLVSAGISVGGGGGGGVGGGGGDVRGGDGDGGGGVVEAGTGDGVDGDVCTKRLVIRKCCRSYSE